MMGPPRVAPNRLSTECGRARWLKLLVQPLAFSLSSLWNSYALPCQLFRPRLVISETCPPDDRPKLAPGFAVATWNSSVLSIGMGITGDGLSSPGGVA